MDRSTLSRQLVLSVPAVLVLGGLGIALLRQTHADTETPPTATKSEAITVSDAGQKVVQVQTEPVRLAPQQGDIVATGVLSFPADQNVKISPRLTGRINRVLVNVGDPVRAGQTLAILDSVDASTAVNAARQNDNKLRLAAANLARQERLYRLGTPDVTAAQANLDQAKARTRFTQDALSRVQEQAKIGGFTEKPLEDAQNALVAARSTLAQAQSDLTQAQRDHGRKVQLFDAGIVAKNDLEASQNVLEKAQANAQAGQESVKLAQQAVDREKKAFSSNLYADQAVRSAQSDTQQALLQEQAAERALRLAKAQIQRDLEQAKSDYQAAAFDADNAHRALRQYGQPEADGTVAIKSPIAGVVTERDVNPGQVVDQSQMTPWQMLVISATNTLWVEADVYEKDLTRVLPGQRARMRVAAMGDRVFSGRVLHIAPALDAKSHAGKVRAEIQNEAGLLREGMYAEVTIVAKAGPAVTMVPLAAIQHDGDSTYVYVAAGKSYVRRTVHILSERDGYGVIDKGIKAEERVVTHGALFLNDQANGG